jgi:hypothetical protein
MQVEKGWKSENLISPMPNANQRSYVNRSLNIHVKEVVSGAMDDYASPVD